MSVNLFAWASIGENGKAVGGRKGDQTGREVKVAPLYDFGQNKTVRFRSKTRGRKAGEIAKWLAKCDSIGYNQSERATLYNLAKACDWDYIRLQRKLATTLTNCDCSSFVATIINLTYGKNKVPCFTTSTMVKSLPTANFKVLPYPPPKFRKGDMPLREGKHVIINV